MPVAPGTILTTVMEGDSRLTDSRTPTSHAASHKSGGSDAIKLDELAAPTDNTTLDATVTAHGLLPKLGGGTVNFLRADGTWAAPTASTPDLLITKRSATANQTVSAGYSAVVAADYEIASGFVLELSADGLLEIL